MGHCFPCIHCNRKVRDFAGTFPGNAVRNGHSTIRETYEIFGPTYKVRTGKSTVFFRDAVRYFLEIWYILFIHQAAIFSIARELYSCTTIFLCNYIDHGEIWAFQPLEKYILGSLKIVIGNLEMRGCVDTYIFITVFANTFKLITLRH